MARIVLNRRVGWRRTVPTPSVSIIAIAARGFRSSALHRLMAKPGLGQTSRI